MTSRPVRTPTVLQMEAVECGAASLGSVLAYFGKHVPLEKLRIACGVSRDGSKASNIVRAARRFGLVAQGQRLEVAGIKQRPMPMIVHWNFNHFLVLEGFRKGRAYLNDPAHGRRVVSEQEFRTSFTGVAIALERGPEFVPGGDDARILGLLSRRLVGAGGAVAYLLLVGIALVIPGLVVPSLVKLFIDGVLIARLDGWFEPILVALAAAVAVRALLVWMQQRMLGRLEARIAIAASAKFVAHVFRLPIQFFQQRFAGEIGARVALNDRVAVAISNEIATAAFNALIAVSYLALMLQYDRLLTLVAAVTAAMNVVLLREIIRRRHDANLRVQMARGALLASTVSALQVIESVKASGTEAEMFSRWAGQKASTVNAEQEGATWSLVLAATPLFLATINMAAVLGIGGMRILDGRLTIGSLAAFQVLLTSLFVPLNALVASSSRLQEAEADLTRLEDVLRYEPEAASAEASTDATRLSGRIELRNVTFGYSPLEPPLITDFTLTVEPGMRVAIIGPSGSGKSTISRLVTGLYEPWSGEILFDGKRRRDWSREVIVDSVALVDQDVTLFSGTLRDNIALWDPLVSETSILDAAHDARIADDIAQRTGTYDAEVEEGGRNFSGGQRQRIELARALAQSPSVLVLDEATAALDPETERLVDDGIRRRGCTVIIIAHRLSTIRDCDEIVVLERGRVVARGTHEDLIADEDGLYAKLVRHG